MNNDIFNMDLTRTLPPALKQDVTMRALSQTIAEELQENARLICNNVIYARIDELPEKLLDILAYDLHIDWYDYDYQVEAKRDLVKTSVKVHKKLGTIYAVETALSAVHPDSKIEEWFDYGGAPFYFRIRVNGDANARINLKDIIKNIFLYKRMTAHLETICIEYHIYIMIYYKNRARAKIKFWPRQNVPVLYLDGMWKLDGSWKLCGYEKDENIDFYPVRAAGRMKVTIMLKAGTGGFFKVGTKFHLHELMKYRSAVRARIKLWPRQNIPILQLDGDWRLDGCWNLYGHQKDKGVKLYPMHAIGKVSFMVGCGGETKGKIGTELSPQTSYIQLCRMQIEVYMRRPLKHLHLDGSWNPNGLYPLIHYNHENGSYYPLKTNVLSRVRVEVNTSKAYLRIHSYLDGVWHPDGSRNFNGGIYEL